MTEVAATDGPDKHRYTLIVYLIIAGAMAWTYRYVPRSYFQTEMDVIRANAARTMSEWLPRISETAIIINAPALAASGTLRPGVWLYYVAANLIAGPNASGQLAFAVFIHMLAAWSLASLAVMIAGDRRAAWAGLIFAVNPVLGDLAATYVNGPAILSMLWLLQAGLCYARYATRGSSGHLIAAFLCVFLSVSTDAVGFFCVFLIAGLEWTLRPRGPKISLLYRISSVVLCCISAFSFFMVMAQAGFKPEPMEAVVHLSVGGFLQGLLYALKGMAVPNLAGRFGSLGAVLVGSALFIAVIYRGLENPKRLLPVILLPFGVVFSGGTLADPAFAQTGNAAVFLIPAMLGSLAAGSLLTAIDKKRILYIVLAAAVGYASTAATMRSRVPVSIGRKVIFIGDEIERIMRGLSDEADIYFVDDGTDRTALLAGHLDFGYRHGLSRSARISLVMGGLLYPGEADSPVGPFGQMMRLERSKKMVFIGWKKGHQGLVMLNALIDEKLEEAQADMDKTHRYIDPFSMGGEEAVANWRITAGGESIPKNHAPDYHWFLEAPVLRLHPTIGIRGYGLGLGSRD